jgi:hypothetical protein
MKKAINKGITLVFGVVPLKHLYGVPIGSRVRYRMRNNRYLQVFIKDGSGVTQYHVAEQDGQWVVCLPVARNVVSRVR